MNLNQLKNPLLGHRTQFFLLGLALQTALSKTVDHSMIWSQHWL